MFPLAEKSGIRSRDPTVFTLISVISWVCCVKMLNFLRYIFGSL